MSDFPLAAAVGGGGGGGGTEPLPVGVAALVEDSDCCGEAASSVDVGVGKLAGVGDAPPRMT